MKCMGMGAVGHVDIHFKLSSYNSEYLTALQPFGIYTSESSQFLSTCKFEATLSTAEEKLENG